MSFLLSIKSSFNFGLIFEFTGEKIKYSLFKYNKIFQNKFDINIFDYKKLCFNQNIPKITSSNLLDYYDYLKRKYIDKYSLQDIKNYFLEFFCEFINVNKIDFELNSSHELAIDILLFEKLKTINLILNLSDYKHSYKTEKGDDKIKKSFLPLFQAIFGHKKISKISKIIIIKNKKDEIIKNDNLFIQTLIKYICEFKVVIKSNIIEIFEYINDYLKQLNKNDNEVKNNEIFKLFELTVPYNNGIHYNSIPDNIEFDIDLNRPFNIDDIDFIKKNNIKNYYLELQYVDLWSYSDSFSNVKKLKLIIGNQVIDNIENFWKVDKFERYIDNIRRRGRGRGRGWGRGGKNKEERIKDLKNNFNINNKKYIEYLINYFIYTINNLVKIMLKVIIIF